MAGRIVVGIDGSKDSHRALQWAFEEARVRKAELVLVHAWEYPISYENLPPDIEQTHAAILAEEAARVVNKGVRISTKLIERRPVAALVQIAADADLLVVGCRGHNRVLRTFLGSVSTGCVHHASCPVVVVRAEGPAPMEDAGTADSLATPTEPSKAGGATEPTEPSGASEPTEPSGAEPHHAEHAIANGQR